ncbi:MAG: hypothetical protein LBB54_03820 [Cellulomonadaceae bacterium]|nr:hypothetical protein [Cellulomonadaceae bacterium]
MSESNPTLTLTDDQVRRIAVEALLIELSEFGVNADMGDIERAYDHWLGNHDYMAWQRGYSEAMLFASTMLHDAAEGFIPPPPDHMPELHAAGTPLRAAQ